MSYVGKWKFHSIGTINENDEMVFMDAKEYLESPMVYIDENDPEAVEDEMKERKQMIGSQIAICEDGNFYMLMPLPEGVSQEEVDAAAAAGLIKLYDGMMTDEPKAWKEQDGELWIEVGEGMSEDGWAKLPEQDGMIVFITTRYEKVD
ncbi:MAG: hypothetical protein IKM22_00405 [Clostridia bacterium]|nr:hypothetical protein [Clostridia bacterium]